MFAEPLSCWLAASPGGFPANSQNGGVIMRYYNDVPSQPSSRHNGVGLQPITDANDTTVGSCSSDTGVVMTTMV